MVQLQSWFYTGPSFDTLYTEYAQKGRIDDQAPVKARSEITINAPVEKVWEVLINLPDWPRFDPSFSDVKLESTVSVGAHASFKLKGFPIQGVFAVVDFNRELTWVGKSLWTRAIDRHVLERTPDGSTRLVLEESFAGLFAPLMISSRRLREQHKTWLLGIKSATETSVMKKPHT
jgi:hypothetical protein